jgi:hypothetical protein
MKKVLIILSAVIFSIAVFAQSPKKMTYQAIVRNASSELVTNQQVGIQISILKGSANGVPVYVETLSPETNANGLISLEFGGGAGFDTINWADRPYFLQTKTDPSGGTNYSISGTSQLLSVPYALYAETSGDTAVWKTNNSNIYFNSGEVGVGTSSPESRLELFDLDEPAELTIHGHGYSFATSALVLKATTEEADRRGSGIFLFDSTGKTEWFAGRPYGNYTGASSDRYVIQRNPNDSVHSQRAAGLIYGDGEPTGTERLFIVENNGFVGIGTGEENPSSRLQIAKGDVYLSDIESGIILKSPNGKCWRLTVNDYGNFLSSPVECP